MKFEIKEKAFVKAVDMMNDCYGLSTNVKEVKKVVRGDSNLIGAFILDSFSDTYIRELLGDRIAEYRIGMDMPTYGDSSEYTAEFQKKMSQWTKESLTR